MIKIKNNLGRSMCVNLKNSTLRLLPYEIKEVEKREISDELKSNEREGYLSLLEKEIVKEVKAIPKKKKEKGE